MTKVAAVIPARWASTRFPGKMLAPLGGRPLVLWAAEHAGRASAIDRVIVATDDPRILETVRAAGIEVRMTSPGLRCGSERVAEAVRDEDFDIVVNLQGDEPFVEPAAIDAVVRGLRDDGEAQVCTLAAAVADPAGLADPHRVKVVVDASGRALYFSRAPIPWNRAAGACLDGLVHLGIYAFRRACLFDFAAAREGRLEREEQLEQLRILEAGAKIRVVTGPWKAFGVDVPADLEAAEAILRRARE